ncbi:MAG: hypothetical protein WCG06_02905 [Candidatus Omnitrophota bacterium]
MIVTSYIESAEPVGSRVLSRQDAVGLSAASIRNVMADLEEAGLIRQPHTSAGRVPTDRGYRYWVDTLMSPEQLTEDEKSWVITELSKARSVESLAGKVSKIVSELTGNAGVFYVKNLKRVSFINHLLEELIQNKMLEEFFEEDAELFVDGAMRIFDEPEFQDVRRMRGLMQAFDEKECFYRIFVRDLEEHRVQIHIGSENEDGELENVSVVTRDCNLDDSVLGGVAAVGPTRMRYPKVVATVDFVSQNLSEAARRF